MLNKINIVEQIKRFLLINVGLLIMAFGLILFLEPADLAVGGVTGFAMVFVKYFPGFSLGIIMGIMNAVLFVVAFIFVGADFGGYTIYCSFGLSAMVGVLQPILDRGMIIPDDLMLTLIMGIFIQGVGMAIVFYGGASTGGTDIVAKIVNKYTGMEIGKALFLSDVLIVLAAGFAFNIKLGLYAFLGILMNGLIIDKVIAGFNTKVNVSIISKNHAKIAEYIQKDLDRGVTYVKSVGGYTKKDIDMLNVVLSKKQYLMLDRKIVSIDPEAFMTMHYVHEVRGFGFTYFKKEKQAS